MLVFGLGMSCTTENKPEETVSEQVPAEPVAQSEPEPGTEATVADPMTPAEFEAWVPQSIFRLPLTESGPNDHSDIPEQGIVAYYDNDTGRNIELRINDMTGELENTRIAFEMIIGKERNNRDYGSHYRKAVEHDGYVADETHDINKRYTFLRFIHGDRYLVDIKANGFTPDELWSNLNEFQLNKLN